MANTIRFIWREKSLEGNPVNGHKTRMKILIDTLKAMRDIDCLYGIPNKNEYWGDIVVSDGLPVNVPKQIKYIFIDSGYAAYLPYPNRTVDLYINPDLGASGIPGSRHVKSAMMGSDFAILDKDIFTYKLPLHKYDVMFISGGNKEEFGEQVGELKTNLSCLYPEQTGDKSHKEFLKDIEQSRVIVTTPSVTMMEAMAMGKPIFLISTSSDQVTNMNHALEHGLAQPFFSMKQIEDMFNSGGLIKMRENARKYMSTAKNGTKRVAEAILELL